MRLRTLVIWGTSLWALAVVGLFYYLLWLQTGQPYEVVGFLDDATGEQLFNAARTSATILGVSGLGGAALIAYRRQVSTEETLDNERTSALHERYTTVAEQLGHDRAAIRLAGIYGLASLTDDWESVGRRREAQTGIDLLCAYLRADDVHLADDHDEDVRLAIVESMRTRLLPTQSKTEKGWNWPGYRFDLSRTDLRGKRLVGANLLRTNFAGANLQNAVLSECTFSADVRLRDSFGEQLEESMRSKKAPPAPPRADAKYVCAVLEDANFSYAKMRRAQLAGCTLTEVDMREAMLGNADLTQADLATANLAGAYLVDASLAGAILHRERGDSTSRSVDLSGAKLGRADLKYAVVGKADLTGADLKGADLRCTDLTAAVLIDIQCDEKTLWPSGFAPDV